MSDHAIQIKAMRNIAEADYIQEIEKVNIRLAADLLETHDMTGVSLDNWESARSFVERYAGTIVPNGV